jgi:hypothetical protein
MENAETLEKESPAVRRLEANDCHFVAPEIESGQTGIFGLFLDYSEFPTSGGSTLTGSTMMRRERDSTRPMFNYIGSTECLEVDLKGYLIAPLELFSEEELEAFTMRHQGLPRG